MLDKAITEFLKNKKIIKTSEENKLKLTEEANEKYYFENWLLSMIKTADSFFTSHPSKLTHSTPLSEKSKFKAKDLNVILTLNYIPDGYLKTGNVSVDMDFSGYPNNRASTELFSFLKIELEDKRTIYEHLKSSSEYFKKQVTSKKIDYQVLRDSFLPTSKSASVTSERIKQVYFPVDHNYHLLSILTPSGIIYKLKQKINSLLFSKENKSSIFGLTSIGYGGAQTQNVSVLNNKNGGKSLLLSSLPPTLEKRQTQPPKINFFNNCLWSSLFERDFEEFHKVLSWRKNNKEVRDMRDDIVLNSITKLKRLVDNIREINTGWSDSETYDGLVLWQKIWLDNQYIEIRNDKKQNHDYLTEAQNNFSNWFINNYKKSTKDNKLLGDDDIEQIKKVLKEERELLR